MHGHGERVEIADPTSDGVRTIEAIRARGIEVATLSLEVLGPETDAVAIVLAGDLAGSRAALERLLPAPGARRLRVIVVGGYPSILFDRLPASSNIRAHYERPTPVDLLVRTVEACAEEARAHRGSWPSSESSVPPWQPPERTLELPWNGELGSPAVLVGPAVPSDVAPVSVSGATELSMPLVELLHAIDRRVFPGSSPLELRFSGRDEPPDVLVPGELLDAAAQPLDAIEEDPLELFTYIGSPPDHEGAASTVLPEVQSRASVPVAQSRPPGARAAEPVDVSAWTPADSALGDPTPDGSARRGRIEDGDGLRLLWRIAELGLTASVAVHIDGKQGVGPAGAPDVAGATLHLGFARGELASLDGPVAQRACASLRANMRWSVAPASETEAMAVLDSKVQSALVSRFEVDRHLRLAREELVRDIVDASAGEFELAEGAGEPAQGAHAAALLGAPLRAVLVECARRCFTMERVLRLLGCEAATVRLRPDVHEHFAHAWIEPECAALIERHDGAGFHVLAAAAGAAEGMPGLVFALAVAGALRLVAVERGPDGAEPERAAVAAFVDAAAALAEDADYFAILRVPRDVPAREIREAYSARKRELDRLPLAAYGLWAREPLRELALDAIEEAYEVLGDEPLCAAYREALARPG